MMEKFNKLLSLCKCSLFLSYNEHKDRYQTIKEYFNVLLDCSPNETLEDFVDIDIFEEMIKRNIMIELIIYPDTPIGNYRFYHYNLEKLIDNALEIL